MYRCRWFAIQELVPPEVYNVRGVLAWDLLDERMLKALDDIRDDHGPIKVNDWASGGSYKYSGLRPRQCDVGAEYSMHRYGRAFDLKPLETTLQAVYDDVLAGRYSEITAVEDIEATPTWCHIDNRNHSKVGIWVVNP